jgi:hypothetical protein
VLAGLSRGGDADDLARTALQDQQVADPDVVAGDGDGVGNHVANSSAALRRVIDLLTGSGGGYFTVGDDDVFFDTLCGLLVLVVVVVVAAVDGVENSVSSAVETVAERMVLAVGVVISHVTLVLLTRWVDSRTAHANLFVEGDGFTVRVPLLSGVLARVGGVAFPLASLSVVFFWVGSSAVTEVFLGGVDAAVEVVTVLVLVLAVVGAVFDVDLGLGVALEGFTIAEVGSLASSRVTWVPGEVHPRRIERGDWEGR